ncbi:MAG: tyrosine-type recombinase/integrase [Microlunatus sp.]
MSEQARDLAAERMIELYLSSDPLSATTKKIRRRVLRRVPNLLDTTTEDLLLWIGRHEWQASTRASIETALRGFYRWLRKRQRYRADDPAEDLPHTKVPPATPRPAPEAVIDQALLASDERTQLMVALGAWAGLRRAEIASLRWCDVVGCRLDVTGKGGRRRQVIISPALEAMLAHEQRLRLAGKWGTGWRWSIDPASPWVFPSPYGSGHLSLDSVYRAVKAALGGVWTTHPLRHRYASQLYQASGHDIVAVKNQMGHTSIATTQRYVGIDPTAIMSSVVTISRRVEV